MSDRSAVDCRLASPPGRGGVAIIDLHAEDAAALDAILATIAPGRAIPLGQWAARRLADLDDGAVARIDDRNAQLMPHGGPAIVRGIAEALRAAGAAWHASPLPGVRPEAADPIESAALDLLATAASPAALPVLLRQSAAWNARSGPLDAEEIERSRRLDRLITPPLVACVGAPNAGKSSLLNALARIDAAIVSEMPGTTRDRVTRFLDLGGVVVEWIDTPGLRETDDPIERAAIELSLPAIRDAVLVVHLTSPDTDDAVLPAGLAPEEGVLAVVNKCDLDATNAATTSLAISATTGDGVAALAREVGRRIVRDDDLTFEGRWAFSPQARPAGDDGGRLPTA